MLIVISPAKALDFTRPEGAVAMTTPQMGDDIAELSIPQGTASIGPRAEAPAVETAEGAAR